MRWYNALMKHSLLRLLAVTFCAPLLGCGEKQPLAVAPKPVAPNQKSNSAAGETASRQVYDSPAKVHAAYVSAIERKEWGKAFDCLTSDRQDEEILGLYFGLAINESK